jgi:uncharacterized protein (DUF1330 family)
MASTATLVVTARPNSEEMESVQAYLHGVMPLFVAAGGTLVKRLKVDQVIAGTQAGMAMVMDFESADIITDLFASSEYAALLPARDRGFTDMNILVTQEM